MLHIAQATPADIPELLKLVNSAYRGEASRKGWTTEADLLEGELRTDAENLSGLLAKENAVILKCSNAGGELLGCVFLEKRENRLYLGMLSVWPELQARGIGKQLLAAAADHAVSQGCSSVFMRVLSKRQELIAWYERHGYVQTDKREPYDAPAKFGVFREPLEFVVMERVV